MFCVLLGDGTSTGCGEGDCISYKTEAVLRDAPPSKTAHYFACGFENSSSSNFGFTTTLSITIL